MADMCGDNRFEIIAKAKAHLLDATNIDTSPKEMEVLDDFLFRCWQMGWLDRYDRKTENCSEIPNNSTSSKMEQVDKDINVRSKDEPTPWCKYCQRRWENDCVGVAQCIRDMQMIAELYKASEDEPQTDCFLCKWLGDVDVCGRCRNRNLFAEADTEPKPKDEPQSDDVFDYCPRCGMRILSKWAKDEPQTDCAWK